MKLSGLTKAVMLNLALISTSFHSSQAAEGGSDRGGGHAYVCFQTAGDRTKVEEAILRNRKNQSKDDPFEGINFNSLGVTVLDYFHAI